MTALTGIYFDADGKDITERVIDETEKYYREYLDKWLKVNPPHDTQEQSHLPPSQRHGAFVIVLSRQPDRMEDLPDEAEQEIARRIGEYLKPQGLLVDCGRNGLYIAHDWTAEAKAA